jgi:hypothetical protein
LREDYERKDAIFGFRVRLRKLVRSLENKAEWAALIDAAMGPSYCQNKL